MPLTQHSDIFGQINESAFNEIFKQARLQRPDIFNYATKNVANSNSFCNPIEVDEDLKNMDQPKYTELDKIPILGSTDPDDGLDFCVQLKDFKLDFSPVNTITLPSELGGLSIQEFAIKSTVCAGVSCGFEFTRMPRRITTPLDVRRAGSVFTRGFNFFPIRRLQMQCFCLSVFLKATLVQEDDALQLNLSGIEIQDLEPVGLENAIECYLKNVLDNSIFPKLKIALSDLIFDVEGHFTIQPTPVGGSVPHNPLIANNSVSVYININ